MKLLETKDILTIEELLEIAYEYGNDQANMPSDDVSDSFKEWLDETKPLIDKLNLNYFNGNSFGVISLVPGGEKQCDSCKYNGSSISKLPCSWCSDYLGKKLHYR